MTSDAGRWSRLIEEHRENVQRLEAAQPAPPAWWALPLGFVAPWICFVAAVASRESGVVVPAMTCFAALVPIGFVCLFIGRLQTVAAGLVLGIGGTLFATAVLIS